MVTNGDRKTNSFGKLVRQKVGLFSSWFSARGARSGWRPVVVVRLSPSKMRAESKGVRAGSEAMSFRRRPPLRDESVFRDILSIRFPLAEQTNPSSRTDCNVSLHTCLGAPRRSPTERL